MKILGASVGVLLALVSAGFSQSTWYVDDDACAGPGSGTVVDPFCKIQDAIDAANDGDTVEIAAGIYLESINFLGKAIAVIGEDRATTAIDGTGLGNSVVLFVSDEGPLSRLQGLELTGGTGSTQLGYGPQNGGGVLCVGASPTLVDLWIHHNTASHGAGIHCYQQASPTVLSCLIENNDGQGGGVYLRADCDPHLDDCQIVHNSNAGWAGALSINDYSSPWLTSCLLAHNSATDKGGACTLQNGSMPLFENCTIAYNSAGHPQGGGALFLYHANGAPNMPMLLNTILWQNSPQEFSIWDGASGTVVASYCDVQGGWPGTGNINANPMFVDAAGCEFHLQVGSPCIDAGDPDSDFDCDGTLADLGAFPFVSVEDCDNNGIPDCQEIDGDPSLDCNANNTLDSCEIAADSSLDLNLDDILDSCECLADNYCITTPNSTGLFARISSDGISSLSLNSFSLTANGLPPSQFGVFFFGPLQVEIPFGDGYRCVGGPLTRLDPPVQFGESGLVQRPLDFTQSPLDGFLAGDTTNFQLWYRDPQPVGTGFNLTNAIEVTLCP